ncbi:MAG: ABC transporter permease [Candidatus Pacebacteria bacterium]|nr:ABC transporter permease [Candidatus Paceibacterota bacterium]
MLPSIPQRAIYKWLFRLFIVLFFVYLVAPLLVVAVFAFNDSQFAALPWKGFTSLWFFGDAEPHLGLFHDRGLMVAMGNSLFNATMVTILALVVGTTTAFLFERYEFPGKSFVYILMIAPLVVPGVIIGISVLVFSSSIANGLESRYGWTVQFLRPGTFLVVLGQFSFIATIATMVIAARLRKFDRSLEEAALNLGATPAVVFRTITLPFLVPALVGSGVVSFLMSFENFSTSLMLVGSNPPLTVAMFERMRMGSSPSLNAVSLFLMVGSTILGLLSLAVERKRG